jgi:hypothetical protein
MHSKVFIGLSLFALLVSTSCAPVYVPTKNNVPLLSGKGEFQGYVGAGVGFNVQSAYALTDNIGVAANYLYAKSGGRNNDNDSFKHQAGELAIGFYKNIRSDLCFEVYTGVGIGKGNADQAGDFLSSTISANSKYNKFFIQPAVGSTEKWLRWNVSLKCSLVDFTSINVQESGDPDITNVPSKVFLTPAITTAYDFWNGRLSASLQVGANTHLGEKTGYHYFVLVGSVGLTYKIKPTISGL